jgi:hypothetical protein
MPGKKGWRSPHPEWWIDEARRQLKLRGHDIKTLAVTLGLEYTKVLRALHRDPEERTVTIETLNAISDELGIPRPIVVAASIDDAIELRRRTLAKAADGVRRSVKGEILREYPLREEALSGSDGSDGRKTTAGPVVKGRDRVAAVRPGSVRGTPRAR